MPTLATCKNSSILISIPEYEKVSKTWSNQDERHVNTFPLYLGYNSLRNVFIIVKVNHPLLTFVACFIHEDMFSLSASSISCYYRRFTFASIQGQSF